jgi:L-ascorbate metabolism protein UlaG (beta-lactamase superfamily)
MNRRRFLIQSLGAAATLLGGSAAFAAMTNSYYSGPVSDHFDGTRFFVPGQPQLNSFSRFLQWRFGNDAVAEWPETAPSPFADTPPERVADTALRVTLIGHATLLIQVAGLNILTDPVYSERASPVSFAGPKRVNPPGIAFDALPPIDAVLVSHGHYDHLDTVTLARLHARFKPRIVCPLGNDAVIAPGIGDRASVTALDWGQSIELGNGVKVHATPSYHWSARGLLDRRKQLWCSFVITSPAGTIYHIADTGYGDGAFFRDVRRQFGPIRLAHIPIGAYEPRWFMQGQHVNPEDAVRVFQDCGAETAIGHHWGTFQLTNEAHTQPEIDLDAALKAAAIATEKFRAFRPGQVWGSPSA